MLMVVPLLRACNRALIALLCCLALLWPRSLCLAEDRMQKELLTSPEYLHAIEQALESFDGRRYAEAHEHFSRAHAIVPNARTLRGLGMVELELGRRVPAARHFELALASDVLPLAGEQRAATEASLAALWLQLARLQVVVIPANATVRVGGNLVPPGQSLLLEPGSYEVEASAEGFARRQAKVLVAAADNRRLDLRLDLSPPPPLAAPALPPAPAPSAAPVVSPPATAPRLRVADTAGSSLLPSPSPPAERERITRSPWYLVSGGAVAAGAGGALLFLAHRRKSRVQDAPLDSGWSAYHDDADSYPRLQVGGLALLGAGVAGMAGGVLWYALTKRGTRQHGAAPTARGVRYVVQF